jgi:hypothetical protein
MVRLAKHRKNRKGGGPPVYLNLNTNAGTPTEVVGAIPQQQTLANAMRQIRRSHGIQANTPTSIAAELSRRHEPVIGTPTPPLEKKPGFFNRLFGRTRKNTGEKKPGFFNRLLGRTQKKNTEGEKKPGFFNRLFGRTKKVQPQPQPLAIRPPPSPPQLAPAPAPPTPPAISRPATPVIGTRAYITPPTIQIPTRFNLEPSNEPGYMSQETFDKQYIQEDFDKAVLRNAWYLKQRLSGKTHDELLPNLQKPGSMTMTKEDLDQLRQNLGELKDMPQDAEFKQRATELFGKNIDNEIDAWEKGVPFNPIPLQKLESTLAHSNQPPSETKSLREQIQELKQKHELLRRQYCHGNKCLLYKGTPQEVIAQGNVGNSLHRFLPMLFTTPEYLQWRTNLQRAIYCKNPEDCYFVGSFTSLQNSEDAGRFEFTDPNFNGICIEDTKKYLKTPQLLEKEFFMSMRYIIDLFVSGNIYFITPNFAVYLLQQFPELFVVAFGKYVQWEKLTKPVAIRMFAIQYFTALQLALETDDPSMAKKVYETYPQPSLGLLQGYSAETLQTLRTFFRKVQEHEGIKPIELSVYINQLQTLKNIQVRKTIQPYTVPQNLVQNWAKTKKVRTANNYRRNEARRAIGIAKLGNSSIVPYNQRFLAPPSYNMTKRAKNNAKTKANLQRRLNAGFGPASAPVGIKSSAYETIPNW